MRVGWSIRVRRIVELLISVEFWPVAIMTLMGMVNPDWLPPALLVAALYWPLRRIARGAWSERTPVDWPAGFLTCMVPLTLWATAMPHKTLPQALRLLAGVALFYALVNWAGAPAAARWQKASRSMSQGSERYTPPGYLRSHRLRIVNILLAWLGLALAIAAPFIVSWPTTKLPFIPTQLYEHFTKLFAKVYLRGDTANPNVMAGSLALLLPLSLAACLFAWRGCTRLERGLYLAAIVCEAAILLLTQSRGAWLALALALLVMLALRWRWGWVIGLGIAMIGVLMATLTGFYQAAGALTTSATLGSPAGRLEVWSRAIFMIQDFPFTGIGMGGFTEVTDRLYPLFLFLPGKVEHAHNLFLQVAVDLGLFGLIFWLAILIGMAFTAWRIWHNGVRSANSWQSGLGAGLLCSQVVLVGHGLTDAVQWGLARPAILVWLIWGMIAAASAFVEGVASNPTSRSAARGVFPVS